MQANEHYDCRGVRRELNSAVCHTEKPAEFFIYDFYYLLSRGKALKNFFPDGFLFNLLDEILDNPKVNVSFEESKPDLFQRKFNILFFQESFPFQLLKNGL